MDELKYSGSVSEDLFIEAQWLHIGKRRMLLWLFPVVMTLNAYISHPSYMFIVVAFVMSSFFPFLFSKGMNIIWRNIHNRSPYLHTPFSASITTDGVMFKSVNTTGLIPWSNFTKIKESENLLLLYQGPSLYNIVAKEFFLSSESWRNARKFVHNKLNNQ